jgi:hypothetical protein
MLIVGSTALRHHKVVARANDLDVWVGESEVYSFPDDFLVDLKVMPAAIMTLLGNNEGEDIIATPEQILTIKCSHLGWDIFWWKHVQDVLRLKGLGYKVIPELYEALVAFWKKEHGSKDYLSLYQTKEEFFQDNVTYIYDHDWLHELVAFPEAPVYTSCLKEGQQVAIDKEKFFAMPFDRQVKMFREEISVIAAERWLISPKVSGKISWERAYQLALKKTCVSLTKNWATDFIVQNIEHFVVPEYSYFEHLLKTVKEGDNIMSKVDITIFKDIAGKLGVEVDDLIYYMCENDMDSIELNSIHPPERNGRNWKDASYRKELDDYSSKREEVINSAIGDYEHLEQEGGGEGGAEYCYGVFRLGDKIYRASYSYYSHNGHEWDGITSTLKEVKPVEKTITVYQ